MQAVWWKVKVYKYSLKQKNKTVLKTIRNHYNKDNTPHLCVFKLVSSRQYFL